MFGSSARLIQRWFAKVLVCEKRLSAKGDRMQKTVVCEMRWFAKCDDLRARNCSWCFQSVCCGLIDVRTLKAAVLHKVSERTKQLMS
jgi:hypothetical protein